MKEEALILSSRHIRPTAMRLLVLHTLRTSDCALSLSDIEARLATADRSTIYRTLVLFAEQGLVHGVDDGSGQTKYAPDDDLSASATEEGETAGTDHTHFFCEACGRTYCLRSLHVPEADMPEGFVMHSATFVVKGLCPHCAGRRRSSSSQPH